MTPVSRLGVLLHQCSSPISRGPTGSFTALHGVLRVKTIESVSFVFGLDILLIQNMREIRLILELFWLLRACSVSFAVILFRLVPSAAKMCWVVHELYRFIAHQRLTGSLLGIYSSTKEINFTRNYSTC